MAHPAAQTGSRRPLYMEPEEWYIHVERMGYYEDLRITENDAFRFSRPCGRNHIYRGLQFPLPLLSQQRPFGKRRPGGLYRRGGAGFPKKTEGAAITGGEPTLQPDLEDFIQKVRALGYQIKLDTNGYRPEVLKRLCEKGLVDYVAMDIKACEERYPAVAGVSSLQMENIRESIEFLKSGAVPYEFRTTVVRELHSAEDFQKIGPWIAGAPLYFLQNFSDSGSVLNPIYTSCTVPELTSYLEIVKPFVGHAELRGIDY